LLQVCRLPEEGGLRVLAKQDHQRTHAGTTGHIQGEKKSCIVHTCHTIADLVFAWNIKAAQEHRCKENIENIQTDATNGQIIFFECVCSQRYREI
jgi:hypothetical protein